MSTPSPSMDASNEDVDSMRESFAIQGSIVMNSLTQMMAETDRLLTEISMLTPFIYAEPTIQIGASRVLLEKLDTEYPKRVSTTDYYKSSTPDAPPKKRMKIE
jgi:hypothetical protein